MLSSKDPYSYGAVVAAGFGGAALVGGGGALVAVGFNLVTSGQAAKGVTLIEKGGKSNTTSLSKTSCAEAPSTCQSHNAGSSTVQVAPE